MSHGHVTMDPHVRLRGTNYDKFLIGKPLTDAKIRKYQREGRYGPAAYGGATKLVRRKSQRRLTADDLLKALA